MTFEQIQKLTGNARRQVQLELPNPSVALLRRLPTYGDFNPALECLDMIRPGFGLVDAPRAWSMALRRVLQSKELGVKPTVADPQ
eukprot:2065688-Heterocapsa_arctica.AAC.1